MLWVDARAFGCHHAKQTAAGAEWEFVRRCDVRAAGAVKSSQNRLLGNGKFLKPSLYTLSFTRSAPILVTTHSKPLLNAKSFFMFSVESVFTICVFTSSVPK